MPSVHGWMALACQNNSTTHISSSKIFPLERDSEFHLKAAKTYKINQLFYEFKTWLGFVFKSNSSLVIHARSFYVFNKAKF